MDLNDGPSGDATEGKVKSASTPIEDEYQAPIQLGHAPTVIGATAEPSVQGSQGLMDELVDVEAGQLRGSAIRTPAATVHCDWHGRNGIAKRGPAFQTSFCVAPDVTENVGDNF
jgi:hypothetical protein